MPLTRQREGEKYVVLALTAAGVLGLIAYGLMDFVAFVTMLGILLFTLGLLRLCITRMIRETFGCRSFFLPLLGIAAATGLLVWIVPMMSVGQ